jgi:hypothetical protein
MLIIYYITSHHDQEEEDMSIVNELVYLREIAIRDSPKQCLTDLFADFHPLLKSQCAVAK